MVEVIEILDKSCRFVTDFSKPYLQVNTLYCPALPGPCHGDTCPRCMVATHKLAKSPLPFLPHATSCLQSATP